MDTENYEEINQSTLTYDQWKALSDQNEKAKKAKALFLETHSQEDFKAWRDIVQEYDELHAEIMSSRGLLLKNHAYPELVDKQLRSILANELLVLRRSVIASKKTMQDEDVSFAVMLLDTFARRIQDVNKSGIETVYRSSYFCNRLAPDLCGGRK